jgi:hypothetical protein
MEDAAARFRRDLEERTGEKVVAVAAASVAAANGDPESGDGRADWGVLVLTDSALRFSRQPHVHWLSSMLRYHDETPPPKVPPELVIPLGDDVSFDMPARGALARLFSPPFERLTVSWKENGQPRVAAFSLDARSALLGALGIDPRKRPARQAR